MNKKIRNRKIILGLLGILGFLGGGGMLGSKVYAACYLFYGAYECSSNYRHAVVNANTPVGRNDPLTCIPGQWEIATSACYKADSFYWGKLKFTSCVSSSTYKSLWEGCGVDSLPTSTDSSPTATSVPPTVTLAVTQMPTATPGNGGAPTATPPAAGSPKPVVVELCSGPTTQPTNTPTPIACPTNGDYNRDGTINTADYEAWQVDYLNGRAALTCFEYWRRAAFGLGGPVATATPTPAEKLTPTPTPG